jgi:hypothetical protein
MKKELITKLESCTCLSDLATQYGTTKSTISVILKNEEAIKEANVAKRVKTLTSIRSPAMEEGEKLLMVWIDEKQVAGNSVPEAIICEKVDIRIVALQMIPLVVILTNHNSQLVDPK